MAARTLKLTLAYDGAAFHGWARQPGLRTVEQALRDALARVWPEPSRLSVAGRTDAGVHARGQVASVTVEGGPPDARVPLALNRLLPSDVAVLACATVSDDFHARFSALARVYEYRLLRAAVRDPLRAGRVWHVPRRLDLDVLDACAGVVRGEHDFRAFTPTQTQHEVFRREVLESSWCHDGDESVLRIAADSFLHQMVRTLVGTMVDAAAGRGGAERLARLLAGAVRAHAGVTAPAHGLCLVGVRYAPAPGTERADRPSTSTRD